MHDETSVIGKTRDCFDFMCMRVASETQILLEQPHFVSGSAGSAASRDPAPMTATGSSRLAFEMAAESLATLWQLHQFISSVRIRDIHFHHRIPCGMRNELW